VKVLNEFGLEDKVPTAGLAKENELLFLPGKDLPLEVPRKSQGLFLLQRIRDERTASPSMPTATCAARNG
jgi:excinuclease ABC subunit C